MFILPQSTAMCIYVSPYLMRSAGTVGSNQVRNHSVQFFCFTSPFVFIVLFIKSWDVQLSFGKVLEAFLILFSHDDDAFKIQISTYMEECVSIVDPSDEQVGTVDGSVSREPEANVAVRPHLHLENYIGIANCPQELEVLIQINDMIPCLLRANFRSQTRKN